MRRLAIVLALTMCAAFPLSAAEAPGAIAFDKSAIKPPDAAAGKVVARVLSEYIYTRSEMPSDRLGGALRRLIVPRVFDTYATQHGIAVTESEIDELLNKISAPEGASVKPKDDERNVARSTILQWKVDASLYAVYGGRVVSQQGNPMEPVGAWEAFLKNAEKNGAIEFFDRAGRDEFYEYYLNKDLAPVPAERVDFKTPWWKK